MLHAPCAVAERSTFMSVRSVLVIFLCPSKVASATGIPEGRIEGEEDDGLVRTVKVLAVVMPVRNCIRIMTEMCFKFSELAHLHMTVR